ncbi:MAG: RNA polymerase sporulation sigma factor SigK [Firmicutes bacterium]|nr:RNA polymerase sporulation sigma factor SigK [Bacillota bacterium]MBQ6949267.1 RNA polymerase sporulation sigma factor SigK [Bacillota bacterium]
MSLSPVSGSSFPRPLTEEEENALLESSAQGDPVSRNRLVEHNLRLVAHIAKKYTGNERSFDDLISIGTIGLIKAVDTYKRGKSVRLATYAAKCIENEILMYIRSSKKLRSEVSLNEPLGTDKDGNEISFNDILGTDDTSIVDDLDYQFQVKRLHQAVETLLTDREKTVIILRFGLYETEPQTQNEVAELLGISRSYVSRIEKKAVSKLKTAFTED